MPNKESQDLGITLIEPNAPTANYLKAKTVGNVVYLGRHGPIDPMAPRSIGKLGSDLELEQRDRSRPLHRISLLSSLKA